MESKLADHDRRISDLEKGFVGLEKGHNALRNDMNIAEVRREHIDQRFNTLADEIKLLAKGLGKINSGIVK